jgi:AcrR family transcriptional regulator
MDAAPARPEDTTRAAVLDAAAACFARYGPRKTTMQDVARSARCARATVYAHFRGKEALYAALLDRITEGFVGEVEACLRAPGSPRAKLRRIVEIARRTYAGSPVLFAAATGEEDLRLAHVAAEAMRRHEARVVELLASVIARGVESGAMRAVDPRTTAYLMYQLGHALVIREVSGRGEFPFARILDAMDDLIDRGLAAPRGPGRSPR